MFASDYTKIRHTVNWGKNVVCTHMQR